MLTILTLLIGIAIGAALAGAWGRKRPHERDVHVQVHELEQMVDALVRAKSALVEAYARHPAVSPQLDNAYRAMLGDALSAVKLALGEGNGHATKKDRTRSFWP